MIETLRIALSNAGAHLREGSPIPSAIAFGILQQDQSAISQDFEYTAGKNPNGPGVEITGNAGEPILFETCDLFTAAFPDEDWTFIQPGEADLPPQLDLEHYDNDGVLPEATFQSYE